jgi:type IV pilus assembly protein PilX
MTAKRNLKNGHSVKRERGITLVIVLVFMVVLTLLGVAGMRDTRLQEQMAAARFERVVSFAAAQAALADGQDFVFGDFEPADPSSKVQPHGPIMGTNAEGFTVEQWIKSNTDWISGPYAQSFGTGSGITYSLIGPNRNPTYIVTQIDMPTIDPAAPVPVFRVTARGEGGRRENSTFLQTMYSFPIATP